MALIVMVSKNVLVAVISAIVVVVIVLVLFYFKVAYASISTSTSSTVSTTSTTSASSISSSPTVPSTQYLTYPYVSSYISMGQITIPIPSSAFVVIVKPTQSNQTFDAYVSMTGKVDDTAVQIVPPTTISATSVLVKSNDIPNYIGYPYLIVNSSAQFTISISYPPLFTEKGVKVAKNFTL